MKSFDPERRLFKVTEVSADASGNEFIPVGIDGVEICNVPESSRFVKIESMSPAKRQFFLNLLSDARSRDEVKDAKVGQYFVAVKRGTRPPIPAELHIGKIIERESELAISSELLCSYHTALNQTDPSLIGVDEPPEPIAKPLRSFAGGMVILPEQYRQIKVAAERIYEGDNIPHPATKEYARTQPEYRALAESLSASGLVEIPGAMFKLDGRSEQKEREGKKLLVAVHPYYLEYHNEFGQRDKLSPVERDALMAKYDALFREHNGPLIVVEEEERVKETLDKLKSIGRQGDVFFVITQNWTSSLFPFTTDREFMRLLEELGVDDLKFVGGHDAGNNPYTSVDPFTGQKISYSGCLRGLANRIEKKGFPKIQTVAGYTYA